MKSRSVTFTDTARADLREIYEWISAAASWETAGRYIIRLERFCYSLDLASERGSARHDVRAGLRIIGFEKRLSVAFEVTEDTVYILRIFRAGRNWEADFSDE